MIVAIVPKKKKKSKAVIIEIKIPYQRKKKKQQREKIKGCIALDTFVFSHLSCYLCRACYFVNIAIIAIQPVTHHVYNDYIHQNFILFGSHNSIWLS